MQLFNIPLAFYLAFVNLHMLSGHPVPSEDLSSEDLDILKVSFHLIKRQETGTIVVILNTITLFFVLCLKRNIIFNRSLFAD